MLIHDTFSACQAGDWVSQKPLLTSQRESILGQWVEMLLLHRTDITGVSRSVNTTCRVLISKPVGLSGFCQSKTISSHHGIMPSMHYSAVHPHPYTKVSVICGPGRKSWMSLSSLPVAEFALCSHWEWAVSVIASVWGALVDTCECSRLSAGLNCS